MTEFLKEEIQASAVRYLLDGGERDAAQVLLACYIEQLFVEGGAIIGADASIYIYDVWIRGPRAAYEILSKQDHPITKAIHEAIHLVLPINYGVRDINTAIGAGDVDANWRKELLEIARGNRIQNQLADTELVKTWNNLRFRSASEVKVAVALDKAGVFFLPNCKGRLGLPGKRENREPDFLVCMNGKWGILEVDGEPFHPPSRTVEDHERDRLFKQHGIRVVEHYDAKRCYGHPEEVVENFLALLRQS